MPRSFHYGFIIVSYAVSWIGAASTLELINRRTSPRGKYNHFLLVSAAVSMGGIAIWCMHFIGNRAIDLANHEPELQISYSSGYTALSFFVPIAVLLLAFLATGTNDRISWWRIVLGGILAGNAICGMHYLGNASIENYTCIYEIGNIIGAISIACVASIIALSVFFVFRAAWNTSWWKRGICAAVLAGAVSGMHWCAAAGTQYQLKRITYNTNQLSRNTTVIVVILLSVATCLVMAGTAIYTAQVKRRHATKAQQVLLASAIFDKQGRILVTSNGMIPSELITNTFLEHGSAAFNEAHPIFHWMFQASRSWSGIANILSGMMSHLDSLPKDGNNSRTGVRLINSHGELIENYDLVFRELFCCAASSLAEKLREHLSQVGVLWDEILQTGASPKTGDQNLIENGKSVSPESIVEKGIRRGTQVLSNGSLMFLVRRVDSRHVDKLEALGYRFADIRQVSPIIRSRMQIRSSRLEEKLKSMSSYVDDQCVEEKAVHLGFFGIRARVGSYGFDVLVRRGARNLLPSVPLPIENLQNWQIKFIRNLDGVSVSHLPQRLETLMQQGVSEKQFGGQLQRAVDELGAFVSDPVYDEATVTAKTVQVPCQQDGLLGSKTCSMIVLRIVVPIHVNMAGPDTEFIPLSFFKIRQLMYKDSPYHAVFTRSVHREVSPIINTIMAGRRSSAYKAGSPRGGLSSKLRFGGKSNERVKDGDGNPIPTVLGRKRSADSEQTGSTIKLWDKDINDPLTAPSVADSQDNVHPSSQTPFGGIMMTQEVSVQIDEQSTTSPKSPVRSENTAVEDNGQKSPQSQRTVDHSRKTSVVSLLATGGGRTGDKLQSSAASGTAIEMSTMSGLRPGSKAVMGGGGIISAVAVENEVRNLNDVATFVDELFAICIDGHSR